MGLISGLMGGQMSGDSTTIPLQIRAIMAKKKEGDSNNKLVAPMLNPNLGALQSLGLMGMANPSKQEEPTPTIKINDTRQIDAATGQKLLDSNRMSANVDMKLAKMIVDTAKKHGIDPATALSIGLNETSLSLPKVQNVSPNSKYASIVNSDPYKRANPFMVGAKDELPDEKGVMQPIGDRIDKNGAIDTFFEIFKNRLATAKRLGKTNEADAIQAYNGYGKINKGTLYGIDTEKTPIDFNTNPIYGKKILDIRENIVKKNPDLMALISSK